MASILWRPWPKRPAPGYQHFGAADDSKSAHGASLTDMPPERFICAATGSDGHVYGIDSGYLAAGKSADNALIDAPDGGTQKTALAAIKHSDIAAIGAVVTAGVPRFVGRSRNTPGTTRKARVVKSTVAQDFAAASH